MSPRGRIHAIYPEGESTVYLYVCRGDNNKLFSFSVDRRCHYKILEYEDDLIGREIEYDDSVAPPGLRFL